MRFSGNLVSKIGIPYWDYSMKIKNENNNYSLITPVLDSLGNVENFILCYQNNKKDLIIKIINRRTSQEKIPKYGNANATSFTTSTINGIFENFNYKIKEDLYSTKSTKKILSDNIKKPSDVYVSYVCWYYVTAGIGYYETTNTQCAFKIVITNMDLVNLNETLRIPDFGSDGGGDNNYFELEKQIIVDTSVLKNLNIKCVYETMASSILKDILAGFSSSNKYNLIVTLDPSLPNNTTGRVTPDGYNIYLKINSNLIDNESSKIWTASTILHEAFHAKLLLRVKEEFGDSYQDLNRWPTPINDMELKELVDYYMQNSQEQNRWASANHDWMVRNIENMSNYLSQYVQKYYPNLHNPSNGLDPYKYLMYHGLQNSKFYDQNYVKKLDDYARDLINANCPQ